MASGSSETVSSNSSNSTAGQDDLPLPEGMRLGTHIVVLPILVIGIFGNMMVILVILKMKAMRTSPNIFLANLAIADLLVLLISGPQALFAVNSDVNKRWFNPGGYLSKSVHIIKDTVFNSSVLTILFIGLDRYCAVCKPFWVSYSCTMTKAYMFCLLAWVLAALTSIPNLFLCYSQHAECIYGTHYKRGCLHPDSPWTQVFFMSSAFIFFLLPLIIFTVVFAKIACNLKGTKKSNGNRKLNKSRDHVVTMLTTIVQVFFVCHLPNRVFYLLTTFAPCRFSRADGYIYFTAFCEVMVYVHSAVNPILYNFMSKGFRSAFKCLCRGKVHEFNSGQRSSCSRRDTTSSTLMTSLSPRERTIRGKYCI